MGMGATNMGISDPNIDAFLWAHRLGQYANAQSPLRQFAPRPSDTAAARSTAGYLDPLGMADFAGSAAVGGEPTIDSSMRASNAAFMREHPLDRGAAAHAAQPNLGMPFYGPRRQTPSQEAWAGQEPFAEVPGKSFAGWRAGNPQGSQTGNTLGAYQQWSGEQAPGAALAQHGLPETATNMDLMRAREAARTPHYYSPDVRAKLQVARARGEPMTPEQGVYFDMGQKGAPQQQQLMQGLGAFGGQQGADITGYGRALEAGNTARGIEGIRDKRAADTRAWQSGENEKNRTFTAGEGEKTRQSRERIAEIDTQGRLSASNKGLEMQLRERLAREGIADKREQDRLALEYNRELDKTNRLNEPIVQHRNQKFAAYQKSGDHTPQELHDYWAELEATYPTIPEPNPNSWKLPGLAPVAGPTGQPAAAPAAKASPAVPAGAVNNGDGTFTWNGKRIRPKQGQSNG